MRGETSMARAGVARQGLRERLGLDLEREADGGGALPWQPHVDQALERQGAVDGEGLAGVALAPAQLRLRQLEPQARPLPPGRREPPLSAVRRPARPYKSPTQKQFNNGKRESR